MGLQTWKAGKIANHCPVGLWIPRWWVDILLNLNIQYNSRCNNKISNSHGHGRPLIPGWSLVCSIPNSTSQHMATNWNYRAQSRVSTLISLRPPSRPLISSEVIIRRIGAICDTSPTRTSGSRILCGLQAFYHEDRARHLWKRRQLSPIWVNGIWRSLRFMTLPTFVDWRLVGKDGLDRCMWNGDVRMTFKLCV